MKRINDDQILDDLFNKYINLPEENRDEIFGKLIANDLVNRSKLFDEFILSCNKNNIPRNSSLRTPKGYITIYPESKFINKFLNENLKTFLILEKLVFDYYLGNFEENYLKWLDHRVSILKKEIIKNTQGGNGKINDWLFNEFDQRLIILNNFSSRKTEKGVNFRFFSTWFSFVLVNSANKYFPKNPYVVASKAYNLFLNCNHMKTDTLKRLKRRRKEILTVLQGFENKGH